ncbi:MAG: hypothetical protein QF786_14570 [Vicinamibacterales bacterium]|nr:hypothetical protein [Vicinamibacterales bacterium]HJN44905.1 hypothetical protein [Vicinamibacterales bacterium]
MKRLMNLAGVVVLACAPAACAPSAQPADDLVVQDVDELVAQAVTPLPEDLRAGATVVTYDPETGNRNVLRQGTNFAECQPKNADTGFRRCHSTASAPRRDLEATLRAEGQSGEEIGAALAAAREAGTLPAPPQGMMRYRLYDEPDRIQHLWVMSLPGATSEMIGVSTTAQRDASLAGQGLPWLMRDGTPGAHVMIPINPRPSESTISDVASDDIAQAVLPLPEDLRDGATVYTYDPSTGERIVLRQGTNYVECQPRNPETLFTRCRHTVTGPRRDLQAKLRAEGKSAEEIQAAVAAALEAGTIQNAPFGTVSYRLYGNDDRIRYLWTMSVPGATAESIGVSTEGQRDSSLRGEGLPWLMRAGTPAAHIMIPINK